MTVYINGQTEYTEASVSDTTVNAYADALDVDLRGAKALTVVVLNTDGVNSLDYKVLARHADYAGGTDEEEQAEQPLAAGAKGLVQLIKGYSRIKIQVKSTVADSHATYTVKYLINR